MVGRHRALAEPVVVVVVVGARIERSLDPSHDRLASLVAAAVSGRLTCVVPSYGEQELVVVVVDHGPASLVIVVVGAHLRCVPSPRVGD